MNANTFVLNTWYVAGFSEEFTTGRLYGQMIAGKPLVLWRSATEGMIALDDRCAHKKMPLSKGRLLDGDVVECPYHGFCFDPSGRCVRIPSQLDLPIPTRARVKAYSVVERDGIVWLWPGDAERRAGIEPPRATEIPATDWEHHNSTPTIVKANYRLLVENLLDVTHFYPLHDGALGDAEFSKIPVEVVEGEVEGNRFVKSIRQAKSYVHPPGLVDWLGYTVADREHTHVMLSPGIVRLELRCAPPGRLGTDEDRGYVMYHFATPIDGKSHAWRWSICTRAGAKAGSQPSKSLIARMLETNPTVHEQDKWALEAQQQNMEFPDDDFVEVHLRSDKALLLARKVIESLEQRDKEVRQPSDEVVR